MKSALIGYEISISNKIKSDPRLVYSYINKKKGISNGIKSLRLTNGTIESDPRIIAKEFNQYFESVFTEKRQDQNMVFDKRTDKKFNFSIEKTLSVYEIKRKLEKIDSAKSSGPDGLNSYFLKECSESLAYPLHLIFVKSITHGKLPNIWKKANVSPTFKSGSKLEKPGMLR